MSNPQNFFVLFYALSPTNFPIALFVTFLSNVNTAVRRDTASLRGNGSRTRSLKYRTDGVVYALRGAKV